MNLCDSIVLSLYTAFCHHSVNSLIPTMHSLQTKFTSNSAMAERLCDACSTTVILWLEV